MKAAKIAISINGKTLSRVDRLVKRRVFPTRSAAIQAAIEEKLERLEHRRLAEACSQLDPEEERAMAEEENRYRDGPGGDRLPHGRAFSTR